MIGGGGQLQDAMAQRGWEARAVRVERLEDLRRAIEELRARGQLDGTFAQERLAFFSFDLSPELPEARSIIVFAVPAPAVRLTFLWRGAPRAAVLPPTYAGYGATTPRRMRQPWFLGRRLAAVRRCPLRARRAQRLARTAAQHQLRAGDGQRSTRRPPLRSPL
jgi:hypothetical protein